MENEIPNILEIDNRKWFLLKTYPNFSLYEDKFHLKQTFTFFDIQKYKEVDEILPTDYKKRY